MTQQARFRGVRLVVGLACLAGIGAVATTPPEMAAVQRTFQPADQRAGLQAFRSDAELREFLQSLRRRGRREGAEGLTSVSPMAAPPPAAVAPQAESGPVTVTGSRIARQATAPDGITNNQEVGVDEGGIVKTYRDMLVILRRGRLFTVSLAGGGMRPLDTIDAFPPGVSGRGDWYDEMLVAGDRVIVIGYSYARGGTEINRFRIGRDGRLRFEDAYHLRSNDYYSSRNYASRLIGNRLIYYTPLYLGSGRGDPLDALPGFRKWDGANRGAFQRITDAREVYVAPALRGERSPSITAMHSVISCDLTAADLDCDATAVLGPASRTFYVSPSAVYLWIADGNRAESEAPAHIYRLPLDGSRPAAVGARGMPVDQFSFREDGSDRRLNVLVRQRGGGDAMGRPEATGGDVALLQVPFRAFGDGSEEADGRFYRDLPGPGPGSYNFQNRFVGDYVLYGTGNASGDGKEGDEAWAAQVRGEGVFQLPLDHPVERIEALGDDALIVGAQGRDLGFTAVNLDARRPRVGDLYLHEEAAQGENRSHAFFFNADNDSPDGASGTMGLPVARAAEPQYRRFFGSAAAMLFLRRDNRRFSPAGELAAHPAGTVDDGCQASCVDWYGNARPIFLGRRVFALLGYELVEGSLNGGRVREQRRVNFAPRIALGRGGAK